MRRASNAVLVIEVAPGSWGGSVCGGHTLTVDITGRVQFSHGTPEEIIASACAEALDGAAQPACAAMLRAIRSRGLPPDRQATKRRKSQEGQEDRIRELVREHLRCRRGRPASAELVALAPTVARVLSVALLGRRAYVP